MNKSHLLLHTALSTELLDERLRIAQMSLEEVHANLGGFGEETQRLLQQTKQLASSLDQYVQETRAMDLSTETLRRRLQRFAIMGGVPFMIGLACAIALWTGYAAAAEDQSLLTVAIVACAGAVAVAISASIHVMVETFVHQAILRREDGVLLREFAAATQELLRKDRALGAAAIRHYMEYRGLASLLAKLF
jgi:hypothetical protein